MSRTGLGSKVSICHQKPNWNLVGPPSGGYSKAKFKLVIIRVTLGVHREPPRDQIGFLVAYSFSTPQAGSRHNLAFPVENFIIGVF